MSWRKLLSLATGARRPRPLPETFIFGVANSDHQCEAYDPELEDIRDIWERKMGLTVRGRATDFWNRYEEDIRFARQLGCTAFRFSIAWSRVETEPGQFNQEALEHYRQLVAAIHAAGMQPILTLHHFTWPVHVEESGGMIGDNFPDLFARYVTEVSEYLGREVRYWVTFNEPSQLIWGYIKPWWERDYFAPPGLPDGAKFDQVTAVRRLMRNLFVAHTQARHIIQDVSHEAQVGANPLLLGLPVWLQRWINHNATRMRTREQLAQQVRRCTEQTWLERGEVDVVIATLTRTPERAHQVMFSEVYFVASQRLLVPSGSSANGPHGLAPGQDLAGKTVVVIKSSTAEGAIRTIAPDARVRVVWDYETALRMLDESRADALLADDSILRGLMAQHPDRYKLMGEPLTSEPYAAAVSLGDSALLDVIDRVVQDFKHSGAWATSYARHLGGPAPEAPGSPVRTLATFSGSQLVPGIVQPLDASGGALSAAQPGSGLRRIQARGYLIVAVKADVPGLGYRDPHTGEYSGLEIDLARALAQHIFGDVNAIRFRTATTPERIPLLRSWLRFLDPIRKQLSVLSSVAASNWWHLGMAGRLPEFLCPQECIGQQDFVGLDYYWGIDSLWPSRIQALIDAGLGRLDRAPVWPEALYGHLRYLAKLFPDLPLLILENGCVDVASRVKRASYIRQHVQQVQRAVADGTNVAGYLCWSITSNREWGYAFGSQNDFGLYKILLDTDPELKREPTPAADAYREIIAQRGVGTSLRVP